MPTEQTPRHEAPHDAAHDEALTEVDDAAAMDFGGDSACWLGRVCDNCGALIEGSRGVPCWRCKTPWQPA
jgi:hypothetical protein